MRIFYIFAILFFTALGTEAQQRLFLSPQFDFGIPSNAYGFNRKLLGARFLSTHWQMNLAAHYRVADRFGIELGIGQNHQNWVMRDKDFASRHDDKFKAELKNSFYYFSLFGHMYYSHPLNDRGTFLYLGAGYSFNLVGRDSISATDTYTKEYETLTTTSIFNANNYSFSGEIGIQKLIRDKNMFSIGLKVNIGQSDMLDGSYTVRNATNTIIASDTYNSKGTFVGLSMKYNIEMFYKPKKIREPKPPKEKKPKVDSLPVVAKDTTKPVVAGRKLVVEHKVTVSSNKVTVRIWDHEIVDGDKVSLNLNGNWILENYELQKQQYVVTLDLQDGVNNFVLHALNLGRIKPNTAAVIIDDGVRQQKVVLESNLSESGTIEITVVK